MALVEKAALTAELARLINNSSNLQQQLQEDRCNQASAADRMARQVLPAAKHVPPSGSILPLDDPSHTVVTPKDVSSQAVRLCGGDLVQWGSRSLPVSRRGSRRSQHSTCGSDMLSSPLEALASSSGAITRCDSSVGGGLPIWEVPGGDVVRRLRDYAG